MLKPMTLICFPDQIRWVQAEFKVLLYKKVWEKKQSEKETGFGGKGMCACSDMLDVRWPWGMVRDMAAGDWRRENGSWKGEVGGRHGFRSHAAEWDLKQREYTRGQVLQEMPRRRGANLGSH